MKYPTTVTTSGPQLNFVLRYIDYSQEQIDQYNAERGWTHPPGRYISVSDLRALAGSAQDADLMGLLDWVEAFLR